MKELGEIYYSKSDDELLLICSEADELTPEAREALKAEMSRRGLTEREAADFRKEIEFEKRREAKQKERQRLMGNGRSWFGKANVVCQPVSNRERFETTFFITFIYLPVVPLGSYRIERLKRGWREKIILFEKLALNWEQVLRAWVITGLVALAAMWALKVWVRVRYGS